MLTEKRMQRILDKLIRNIQVETDILDSNGLIVASSDKSKLGETRDIVQGFVDEEDQAIFIDNNRTYMKFTIDKNLVYFLSMDGTNRVTRNYCLLTVSLIEAYLKSMIRKMDKEEIMQRIFLNQLNELEVQELVKDYKMDLGSTRCVILIRTENVDGDDVYELLLKVFPKSQSDILVLVNGMTVALVKNVTEDMEDGELLEVAGAMEDTILNELSIRGYIGIGGIKGNIFQLRDSYEEAEKAIEVGRIYNTSNRIYMFDSLLLERFLYEVPLDLCEKYSRKLDNPAYDKLLSDEMLRTIDQFFENSLNLSETSRQLFIHRNTLVYRLDKIQRTIGLDLRNFHDAVTFKILLMLRDKYNQEG